MRGRNGNAVEPILAGLWRGHKLGRARRFCSHVGVRLVEQIPMSLIARKVFCAAAAPFGGRAQFRLGNRFRRLTLDYECLPEADGYQGLQPANSGPP